MFEYGKALDKVLEDLFVDIGDFVVAEWCFVKSSFYHAGRDADGGRVSRDILDDDRIGTDFGIFADGDIAEYLGSCTEYDIVFDGGVAFSFCEADTAERDLLIDDDIIVDDSCLTDNDTNTMIDEDASAYLGSRVDIDRGEKLPKS